MPPPSETLPHSRDDAFDGFLGAHPLRVLYGAGIRGEYISHYLRYRGLDLAGFSDSNPARWGDTLNGYPILEPGRLPEGAGILVTSEKYGEAIRTQLQAMGKRPGDIHVIRQTELQDWFKLDRDWPAYITRHHYLPSYLDYFQARGIDCSGPALHKGPYAFPNVFRQGLDYQISFFSEIGDFVLPALCDDLGMLAEGPAELGPVRLEPGDVVLDAGANIGLFSMVAAARGCRVFAFEPVPEVATMLELARELHPAISICRQALSDRSGRQEISLSEGTNTSNSLVMEMGNRRLEVEAITVDDFARIQGLDRIDFIKADIEGAERWMLKGASGVLKQHAPRLSICTYHAPEDPELLEALVREANPAYVFEHRWQKMYAHVPE